MVEGFKELTLCSFMLFDSMRKHQLLTVHDAPCVSVCVCCCREQQMGSVVLLWVRRDSLPD